MTAVALRVLDERVAAAHGARSRVAATLAAGSAEVIAALEDPLAPFRDVAGKRAYDAVRDHVPGLAEAPLREGLLRWIHALLQARMAFEPERAFAREASATRGHVRLDVTHPTSYRDAWRGAVLARDRVSRVAWLEAAAALAPALAPLARDADARRTEVTSRLGLAGSQGRTDRACDALRGAARELLAKTADLRAWLRRDARDDAARPSPIASWLERALARDAADGWPARLSLRWLQEAFPRLTSTLERGPKLPSAAGASSFARALYALGRAIREGARPQLPHAVARDPFWVDPHRIGFLVGALPAETLFHRKVLGLGARAATRQARALARTALHEAAWIAARWLLADPATPRHAWQEVMHDLFGGPVDERFRGAWPDNRGVEGARLEALLGARGLSAHVVSRFDEDWFANPRAAEWLRARAVGPAEPPADGEVQMLEQARALAAWFEEALG